MCVGVGPSETTGDGEIENGGCGGWVWNRRIERFGRKRKKKKMD
jgi:hypothetical protein